MPLTKAGKKAMASMVEEYGEEKGKRVFYASINKGKPGSEKWHNPGLSSAEKREAAMYGEKEEDEERVGKAFSKLVDLGSKHDNTKPQAIGDRVMYPSIYLDNKQSAALGADLPAVGKPFRATVEFEVRSVTKEQDGRRVSLDLKSLKRGE